MFKYLLTAGALGLLAGVAGAQGSDLCATAMPIVGVGNFAFDNSTATRESIVLCASHSRDVWFSWTAPSTGNYVVSTCGLTAVDTIVAVFPGPNCPTGPALACNDDSCGLQSSAPFTATAGVAYSIVVAAFTQAGGTGSFSITAGGPGGSGCNPLAVGPDLVVASVASVNSFAAVGGVVAYSLGTDVCNLGDQVALYGFSTPDHPLCAQNIYRLDAGRFEHLGQSWATHIGNAFAGTTCCAICTIPPAGNGLGTGCSDATGPMYNGNQTLMGPRSEVNPLTGVFPNPWSTQGTTGDTIYKRAQVRASDVLASNFPNATYYGEVVYIGPGDTAAGNGLNNASWRRLARTTGTTLTVNLTSGATRRSQPAIYAWLEADPTVDLKVVDIPGEGRLFVASNCYDGGNGSYRYEYCVFNLNSERAVGSFSVPIGAGAVVAGAGMSFPPSHSGEPTSNAPWTAQVLADRVVWSTDTFGADPNANAVRWGTTYSFWFISSNPPEVKASTLGLFRPGVQVDPTVDVCGPIAGVAGPIVTNYCTARPNSTGQAGVIAAQNFDLVGRTMELAASNLPSSAFAYSLASETQGFVANPGGSAGNLCVTGNIGRSVGGSILNTGPSGILLESVDLDVIPQPTGPVTVLAGATWYFQFWHRDTVPGLGVATSNFTDGVRVVFP